MRVTQAAGDTPVDRARVLERVSACSAASLQAWFAALHLGVVVCFALGAAVPAALAPIATAVTLLATWWFCRSGGLTDRQGVAAAALAGAVIAAGLAIAAAFLDLTWDGQWYHQTAVYEMAAGWNPLRDPLHPFGRTWDLWVLHYAKGPWYVALALFAATGSIELAKAAAVIAPAGAALVVFAAALDFGLARRWALLLGLLTALNPVTTCALVTHQVDGIMVSFMACAVAAGIGFCRRPTRPWSIILFLSAALAANTKFTGLVYLCFFGVTGAAYCVWRRRDVLGRYAALVTAALIFGVVVLGFNPYVTNTLHRGHPFYPVQGTAEHPSLAQQGEDPIERYETPRNLVGRSRVVRLAYGMFGRPGTAPYVTQDAALMWPFAATTRDFALYYFHDVRIAGFGPLFSGALLLAAALTVFGCARRELPCGVVLLLCGAILASLLVSTHTWWARYGPHLWWLPIVPVAAALRLDGRSVLRRAAIAIAWLLLIDTLAVTVVHARWEWRSTQALRRQLADLRTAGPMTVNLGYFDVPVAERLHAAGIAFDAVRVAFDAPMKYECPAGHQVTLMSVCRGYPDAVRICLADASLAARLQAQPQWQWSAEP
jgi:hypothetical protein